MSKQYFHRFPGAKFFMPAGQEICFAGGEFNTATVKDTVMRAEVEKELDKIANSPASMIYTKDKDLALDVSERATSNEVMETATAGFDNVNKINSSQAKTVELPQAHSGAPQIPGSGHQKGQGIAATAQHAAQGTAGSSDAVAKARASLAAASNSSPTKS